MKVGLAEIKPKVSVIVPTFRRPNLIVRAVETALSQVLKEIEVIVVVDGSDDPTLKVLEQIADPRLRCMVSQRHLGQSGARNLGVAYAHGSWVAFLDDDDTWMPEKLEAQLRSAENSSFRYPIISCRLLARSELGEFVWPRRFPREGEPLSEYLFCRRTPFTGEGIIQTSTVFTTRELLEKVPFTSGMRRYADVDWILRASEAKGVGIEFVPEREPLSVWNMEKNRPRISNNGDGAYGLAWARAHRRNFTKRSYASFLLTVASANAAKEDQGGVVRTMGAFFRLGWEAFCHGVPSVNDVLTHVANFILPGHMQALLANLFARVWGRLRPMGFSSAPER